MENEYKKLFDGVHASRRLKTEVLNMKNTQKRSINRRKIPAALAAACLCIVLLGTAGAARVFQMQVDLQTNPDHPGSNYTATGGIAFFPADSFPQQVHDLAASSETADRSAGKNFKSWAELEEFLGWDLPDSTALYSAEPGPISKMSGSNGGTHILLWTHNADQELVSISANGNYVMDGIWIRQSANLFTDKMEQNYKEYGQEGEKFEGGIVMIYDEGSTMTEETYTTPGGLTATIVEVKPAPDTVRPAAEYNAHFSINGIQYKVSATFYSVGMTTDEAADKDDPAHTLEVLKTVLDGFDA